MPTRLALLLAVLPVLLFTASPASAQDDWPPYWVDGLYFDPDTLSIAEALQLALDLELATPAAAYAINLARYSGDPAYIPILKQHAEFWGSGSFNSQYSRTVRVLDALWMLGEPEDYFYGLIHRWDEKPTLASAAIYVVRRHPRPERVAELDAVAAAVEASGLPDEIKREFTQEDDVYRSDLAFFAEVAATPLDEQLDLLFRGLRSAATSGDWTDDGEYVIYGGDVSGEMYPFARWSAARLHTLARTYPSAVQAFLDTLPSRDYFADDPPAYIAAYRAMFEDLAALEEVPPPPPPAPGADVMPRLDCVRVDTTYGHEGTYLASFSYANRHGVPVTVPYGPDNRITPLTYDGQQPEVFFFEDSTYTSGIRVRFQPGEAVTWTLTGRTTVPATDDPALRCGVYSPLPDLTALPAAVAVTPAALSAGFNGTGFLVSGFDHALDGTPIAGADTVHAVTAAFEAAAQAVLAALAPGQHGRVVGAGPAPSVAAAPLGLDAEAWAEALVERATVTLPRRPTGTAGTLAAPVVAYAPDGLDLRGNFSGAGVLVVDGTLEDAALDMTGNVSWTGLVVVRGQGAATAALDLQGSVEVVGGVLLVGEAGAVSLAGSAEVCYSRAALGLAQGAAFGDE